MAVPWAANVERALRPRLAERFRSVRLSCLTTRCHLVIATAAEWPVVVRALGPLWNHELVLVERAPGAYFVDLLRHPADRSGTPADGMPSSGPEPADPCLAGYACEDPAASEQAGVTRLSLAEGYLCFTSAALACACGGERHLPGGCVGYEY